MGMDQSLVRITKRRYDGEAFFLSVINEWGCCPSCYDKSLRRIVDMARNYSSMGLPMEREQHDVIYEIWKEEEVLYRVLAKRRHTFKDAMDWIKEAEDVEIII
jgi:hypothetical protein